MEQWEYKICNGLYFGVKETPKSEEKLNRLGAEGWEIVGITNENSIILKRKKEN